MEGKKIFVIFFLLILGESYYGLAQNSNVKVGVVIDSITSEFLPLVNVQNSIRKRATLTTNEGKFRIDFESEEDTICFKLLGYKFLKLSISEMEEGDTIHLVPDIHNIDEVVILADNSKLYELISSCKKHAPRERASAKSFVEINTYSRDKQIELLQGYYNADFEGYELVELKTKNVRFGIQPLHNMLYTSLSVSKMFYEHKLFEQSDLFPGNPLLFSPKELRKRYHLFLNAKYKDEEKTIVVISFKPKTSSERLFSGKIWIDSASRQILQLNLEISNAAIFPFESIYDSDKLKAVELKITKIFEIDAGHLYTQLIDFQYKFDFITKSNNIIPIRSHATLNAYNYAENFISPYFNFSKEREMSRLWSELNIIEYDSLFWNCTKEFRSSSNELKNQIFIDDSLTISNTQLFKAEVVNKPNKTFASFGVYRPWNGKTRIFFKDLGLDTSVQNNLQAAIPSDHYQLCAQIYMNITENCDSIVYQTKTLFDPFKTYYHYPITMNTIVFMNIYFDIIEIQRRKLDESLKTVSGNIESMKHVYEGVQQETEQISELYFNEVNRGINTEKLAIWNAFVLSKLGIDNISLFKSN